MKNEREIDAIIKKVGYTFVIGSKEVEVILSHLDQGDTEAAKAEFDACLSKAMDSEKVKDYDHS